ncbi:MAG: tetratricopeptide repeat protein [Xanthobacteraceae bacterium]
MPIVAVLAAGVLVCAVPAFAQSNRAVEPPSSDTQAQERNRSQNVDFLFKALKAAPDETTAKAISDRILGLWLASGGDTTNLLMSRVRTAIEAKDIDLALQLLNAVIEFKPEYVEAWDQRATIYYMKKDYGEALTNLAQVLAREPRHFGALFGLGIIMQEFGDDKRALEVYRRLLEIDPHMQRVPELVQSLSEKIEGRDI